MTQDKKTYYVYMLECVNGHFYTGYTTDLSRRYQEHLDGSAKCKYTRSFPPVRIAAEWSVGDDLSTALKLERQIKRLSKNKKLKLVEHPESIEDLF